MKANLIRNKTFLITGGDTEFGAALALEVAAQKGEVLLVGEDKGLLNKTIDAHNNSKKKAGKIVAMQANIANSLECEKVVSGIKKTLGKVDVIVFNNSTMVSGKFEDHKIDLFDKIINHDIKGSLCLAKYGIPAIKENKKPAIITISSFLGSVSMPYFTLHSTIAHALDGFYDSLRREYSSDRIRFLNVRLPLDKSDFSDDCAAKLGKLGFSFRDAAAAAKMICEAFNEERTALILDKKEKGLVFSNKFSPLGMDNRLKKIKNKILNAVQSNG